MTTLNNHDMRNAFDIMGFEYIAPIKPGGGRCQLASTKIVVSKDIVAIYLTEEDIGYMFGDFEGMKFVELLAHENLPMIGMKPMKTKKGGFKISKYGKSYRIRVKNSSKQICIRDNMVVFLFNHQHDTIRRDIVIKVHADV